MKLKPLSVTTNVVGLQTDDAGHLGQNSSAHLACVVGLQTDAVVVNETHFRSFKILQEVCTYSQLKIAEIRRL